MLNGIVVRNTHRPLATVYFLFQDHYVTLDARIVLMYPATPMTRKIVSREFTTIRNWMLVQC